jgi:hypothetical protein
VSDPSTHTDLLQGASELLGARTEPFARELERVPGALGEMAEEGMIERAEHVGFTSVPGLLRSLSARTLGETSA